MIGIIDNEISAYSVIEKLQIEFPNTNIYLYPIDNLEDGIKKLTKKECNFIILKKKQEIANYENKYPNIIFLSEDSLSNKNSFLLNNPLLIQAVEQGNQDKVNNILNELKIEEEIIYIDNPKLLFIKTILQDKYPNKKITDSIDIIIEEINQKKEFLKKVKETKVQILIEEVEK